MKGLNKILLSILLGLFFLSLGIGALNISVIDALSGKASYADSAIFWQLRLPRSLIAMMAGMTLGLTGAAMQGLLRNPLADSGVLGISGGAVLGAMISLYTGFASSGAWLLPVGGFLGALVATALILIFCLKRTSLLGLILAGTALNTLFFALGSLLLSFSNNPYAILEIIYWQMGSFENRTLQQVLMAGPWMVVGWILLFSVMPAIRLLTLGEDVARTAGVSMPQTLQKIILGTALSVGALVAVCGSIGFVGLFIPHLMRPFVKHDPARLLPASALAGGIFMLVTDILCRIAVSGIELKIGILTALIGAPFFIFLAFKTKSQIA